MNANYDFVHSYGQCFLRRSKEASMNTKRKVKNNANYEFVHSYRHCSLRQVTEWNSQEQTQSETLMVMPNTILFTLMDNALFDSPQRAKAMNKHKERSLR